MARNQISQAVDSQERTGVERLRDTGRLGYRAATIQQTQVDNSLGQAFSNFAESAGRMYGIKRTHEISRADERSNEIIRKLTPEQRRQAIANGTLLYQDDLLKEALTVCGKLRMFYLLVRHLCRIKRDALKDRPQDDFHFTNVVSPGNHKHIKLLKALGAVFATNPIVHNGHTFRQFFF